MQHVLRHEASQWQAARVSVGPHVDLVHVRVTDVAPVEIIPLRARDARTRPPQASQRGADYRNRVDMCMPVHVWVLGCNTYFR